MQEIPRTADHAPSRTLYTWRVDATAAAEKLAADLYKAALNVRLRLEHEITHQSDVRLPLYFPKHWLQFSMLKSNCWHTETCLYTLQLVAAYWHGTDAQALCVLTISSQQLPHAASSLHQHPAADCAMMRLAPDC